MKNLKVVDQKSLSPLMKWRLENYKLSITAEELSKQVIESINSLSPYERKKFLNNKSTKIL